MPKPEPSSLHDTFEKADQPASHEVSLSHGHTVFRCTPGDEAQLLEHLAEMAADPDQNLKWFEAANLADQLGKQLNQQLQQMKRQAL